MTRLRTYVLLTALGIFGAIVQLVATRWGLAGDLAGGFLCGAILLGGIVRLRLMSNLSICLLLSQRVPAYWVLLLKKQDRK
jgi:hypothetical protein